MRIVYEFSDLKRISGSDLVSYDLSEFRRIVNADLRKYGQRVKSIDYSYYTYRGNVDIMGIDHEFSERRVDGVSIVAEPIDND
ncbi:hypothetical protein [Bacillus licheniformis]|uniref:hypothetical protein n=1 Tax=Bacillus licheniformis TaxID=1402 RepID=UPI001CD511C2|nr:hypothetical protein [Bacillus licheniformis]MCA1184789.1 hypothetical protein [Bacillus licheniformis]